MKETKKEKIKKASKYLVNFLNMINMFIVVLSPIWEWHLDNVTKTIVGVAGVISTYLVSGKLFDVEIENHEIIDEEDDEYDED